LIIKDLEEKIIEIKETFDRRLSEANDINEAKSRLINEKMVSFH
jgi:hypothetical protein